MVGLEYKFTPKALAELYGGEIVDRFVRGSDFADAIKLIVEQAIEHDRRSTPAPVPDTVGERGALDPVALNAAAAKLRRFHHEVGHPGVVETEIGAFVLLSEVPDAIRAYLAALSPASTTPDGWRADMENAPRGRTLLLWAATAISEDGTILNWVMDTGFIRTGHGGSDLTVSHDDLTDVHWHGRWLKRYEIMPTHWQLLPGPPATPSKGEDAGT